ncbi:hypothetical protein D3C72_1201580 [compost metagenome]
MSVANHHGHVLVAKRVVVILAGFVADQRAAEHEVEMAVVELAEQAQAGVLDDLERQVRMCLPQLFQRRHQHIGHRAHDHADGDAPAAAGANAGHFLAHGPQVRHQLPRMADHAMAKGVGAHAASGALEQRRFQHAFEFLQRLAGGRLGHRHRGRGLVQRLVLVERDQQLQLLHAQAAGEGVQGGFHVWTW